MMMICSDILCLSIPRFKITFRRTVAYKHTFVAMKKMAYAIPNTIAIITSMTLQCAHGLVWG